MTEKLRSLILDTFCEVLASLIASPAPQFPSPPLNVGGNASPGPVSGIFSASVIFHNTSPSSTTLDTGDAESIEMSTHTKDSSNSNEVADAAKPEFSKPPAKYSFTVGQFTTALKSHHCPTRESVNLVNRYIDAHLLHVPTSRSQSSVSHYTTRVQPTPKAFACLESWLYVQSGDIHSRPELCRALMSNYNSLDILLLDRSLSTHKLHLSTGLAMLLWVRMMGTKPQLYDQFRDIPPPVVEGKRAARVFNPNVTNPSLLLEAAELSQESILARASDAAGRTELRSSSPYFARTAMHPNSANISQYWDTAGIRLFSDLCFERAGKSRFSSTVEYTVDYVVTGHAIVQWIMDCTNVESPQEGSVVAKLLLSNGFLKRITDPVVDAMVAVEPVSSTRNPELTRSALYQLTSRGRQLSYWGQELVRDSHVEFTDTENELDEQDFQIWNSNKIVKEPKDLGFYLNVPASVSASVAENEGKKDVGKAHKNLTISPIKQATFEKAGGSNMYLGDKWDWLRVSFHLGVDKGFTRIDLQTIAREPALRLMFRESLRPAHNTAPLDFLEPAQHLLVLARACTEAKGTVTRLEFINRNLSDVASKLCKQFIEVGSPLELNVGDTERQALLRSVAARDWKAMQLHIQAIMQHARELLRDAVTRFKAGNETREVPLLRDYVVARYIVQPFKS